MRSLFLVPVCWLAIAGLVWAEPLDQRSVSADAKWLVHIDLDALNTAKVFQPLRKELLAEPSIQREIERIQAAIGTNPTEDVHGVTLYGTEYTSGVVILRAKANVEKIRGLLQEKPDYSVSSFGTRRLHSWTDHGGTPRETRVTGCFFEPGVIVFGRDAAEVRAALKVLDGKSAALAGSDSPLAEEMAKGTIVQARAIGLADAQDVFRSPLIKLAEVFSISAGEDQDTVFLKASVTAKTSEMASDMRDATRGLLFMAKLQVKNDPEIMRILDSLDVTLADKTFILQWRGSSEEVLKLIEKMREKAAAR